MRKIDLAAKIDWIVIVGIALTVLAFTIWCFQLQYQSGYEHGYCEGSGGTLIYDMCVGEKS